MSLYDNLNRKVSLSGCCTITGRERDAYSLQMPLKMNQTLIELRLANNDSYMTPQAKRAPAFPVDLLSSCPPSPRSSWSA